MNVAIDNLIRSILAGAGNRGLLTSEILAHPEARKIQLVKEDAVYTLRALVYADVVREIDPEPLAACRLRRYSLRAPAFSESAIAALSERDEAPELALEALPT